MPQPRVSVIIPTMKRANGLKAALSSLRAQIRLAPTDVEIIVVDNDPQGSAVAEVAAARTKAVFPITYIHMPEPGVSNARNAGLAVACGEWVAFLDDDEVATPRWLATLLADAEALKADVVFGAIQARLPNAATPHAHYFERFFGRHGPDTLQKIEKPYGCGNSLIRRARMPMPAFSATRNELGGEDDELFAALKRRGAVLGWSPLAIVFETPNPDRVTLRYTLLRAFQYGQAPVIQAARRFSPDLLLIGVWMMHGVSQGIAHSMAALASWIFRRGDFAMHLDRVARGFGKVLWFPPFRLSFYGRRALESGLVTATLAETSEVEAVDGRLAH
jgi:glycosyltransferase involved in cell wall biosynthesis